jgi:uncharacterized protein (DUF58 family)
MAIRRYRFFRGEQAAQLRRLELTVRGVVEGVFAGLHKSPHKGFSIEFAEHREYVAGDEIKHLDWTVLARSDRYYVKQYEQETNLRATICLDASGSMGFSGAGHQEAGKKVKAGRAVAAKGSAEAAILPPPTAAPGTTPPPGTSKFEYAAVLAASLAFMLSNQQDLVGLTVFDSKITLEIPQGNGPSHLDQIFRKLEEVKPGRETRIAGTLHHLANKIPRRGLVILISDLLDEPENILLALQHLKHARHQMIVLQVLDRAEVELPYQRPVIFEDMENRERLQIDPKQIREEYRREMGEFLSTLQRRCGQFQIDYVQAFTDVPWDVQIREVLRRTGA